MTGRKASSKKNFTPFIFYFGGHFFLLTLSRKQFNAHAQDLTRLSHNQKIFGTKKKSRCSKLRVNGKVISDRSDLLNAWADHFSTLSKTRLRSEEGLQNLDTKTCQCISINWGGHPWRTIHSRGGHLCSGEAIAREVWRSRWRITAEHLKWEENPC